MAPVKYMVPWTRATQNPNGILISSSVSAQLTRAPNTQTHRPRYVQHLLLYAMHVTD